MKYHCVAAILFLILINISPHASAACDGLQIHAHRGIYNEPENSMQSTIGALEYGFDAPEFDVQRLNDGAWVLHHDALTGRIALGIGKVTVDSLDSDGWRRVYLAGRNGRDSGKHGAFLSDVLDAASSELKQNQKLNIEIKGIYSCEDVRELRMLVASKIPDGQYFFTSVDISALSCLRQVDARLYLGLIVEPDVESVEKRHPVATHRVEGWARRFGINEEALLKKAESIQRQDGNYKYLAAPEILSERIGHPSGVHIDARMVGKYPDTMKKLSDADFSIFTYGYNGDIEHVKVIRALRKQGIFVRGAVIEGKADKFCNIL